MAKTVWFDMDGTLYDLYNIPDWLERLLSEDAPVFYDGRPMYDPYRINKAIKALVAHGWDVGVVTWAPKDVEEDSPFFTEVAYQKLCWIRQYYPELAHNFHCIPYGDSKRNYIYETRVRTSLIGGTQVLVDDNRIVRDDWEVVSNWFTIDATHDYCKELEGLVM